MPAFEPFPFLLAVLLWFLSALWGPAGAQTLEVGPRTAVIDLDGMMEPQVFVDPGGTPS